MSDLTDEEVVRLSSLSDEALLIELGRALFRNKGSGLQARPPNVKKIVDEARAWIVAKNGDLQAAVCADPRVRSAALSEQDARAKLVRVIADVVTALAFYVPAGTIAEILVRDGIPEYCKPIWNRSS